MLKYEFATSFVNALIKSGMMFYDSDINPVYIPITVLIKFKNEDGTNTEKQYIETNTDIEELIDYIYEYGEVYSFCICYEKEYEEKIIRINVR